MEARPERLKRCTSCPPSDCWWPVTCFTRDKGHPDGFENRCKACRYAKRNPRRRELRRQRRAEGRAN